MSELIANYINGVKNYFNFLKETNTLNDLYAKSIPLKNDEGCLIPLCQLHLEDLEIIKKLAEWRKKNSQFFPSQFEVTMEGTKRWIQKNVLEVEDRILFIVLNRFGHAIGHLGFANAINDECQIEVDNVVRGIAQDSPGIMLSALQKLIDWVEEFIGPQQIILRVFNDNLHAIKYYKKLGFIESGVINLYKYVQNDGTYYKEAPNAAPPDKFFLKMMYMPSVLESPKELISTAGPSISAREISYANDAVRNGWNSQWNSYLKRLENYFCEYLGVNHSLATSSCTGALHIALCALGIGPGDEVIVPDITWVATANAVVYVGATPIFADVDSGSWCMNPESFEKLITSRTKAVIPVHLYGHPAKIDEIVKIARKHKLYVIEDAAPSVGAKWKGTKTGTFGDFATFSFQGAKLAVSGEGGMLVTNNEDLYLKAYAIWDQGREPNSFWINQNGLKYKMSNIQAAVALGQLERVEELISAKRRIFSAYSDQLSGISDIHLNYEVEDAYSIYWMTSIVLNENCKISRDNLRDALKNDKIDTRPVFPAISQYPHWPSKQSPQPNALRIGNSGMNLPSGVCLKKEQVNYICKSLKKHIL